MLYFYLLVYANQSTDMTKYQNIIEHFDLHTET